MLKNLQNKKIICSFNDFSNIGFIEFLNNLSKKNNLIILTKNNKANFFFKDKRIKIINIKEKKTYLSKILFYLSINKISSLEKFYHIDNVLFQHGLFKKLNSLIKIIMFFLRIGLNKNFIRSKIYANNDFKIDCDLILTDFRFNELYTNHSIVYAAKKLKIPSYSIIFSWDNIFSNDVNLISDKYFISTNKLKLIMSSRHKINKSKIHLIEPFQLNYLSKNKKKIFTNKKKYLLFLCCSEENSRASFEEFEIINFIGDFLKKKKSNIILKVRPYPFYTNKKNIINKIKHKNILIEEYGKKIIRRVHHDNIEFMRYEKNYEAKIELIKNSLAVINFFTTIGIESVLMKKYTIFLNLKKQDSGIFNYLKSNYFKVKFLDHYSFLNNRNTYIKSKDKLINSLEMIIKKKNSITYSKDDFNYFKKIFYN